MSGASERRVRQYAEASTTALAALIHEEQTRRELSAACENEGKSPELSAYAQAKRQAVYAASEEREIAADLLLRAWEALS